jgi:uracil phosphoribosyltransferase
MKVSIGSDHAGFDLKKKLIAKMESLGHQALDRGASSTDSVDYPDFAALVAGDVISGEADRGVLICGTGIGMSITANKFRGIRAALVYDLDTAKLSRMHNDANIMCVGARTPSALIAPEMLEIWLSTQFEEGRHRRRVCKMESFDKAPVGWQDLPNVHVINHPMIQHKLSLLRQKDTEPRHFRDIVSEIAKLMAYEVTRDVPLAEIDIETPICHAKGKVMAGKHFGIVAILRAGLAMAESILEIMPGARMGHIGLYRDPHTLQPVQYYSKLPADTADRNIILVDPMLATGGTIVKGIDLLKKAGAKGIKVVSIVSAPEGIRRIVEAHPDVEIYVASVDEKLNDHGYIVPGLGDAGDRLYGTK